MKVLENGQIFMRKKYCTENDSSKSLIENTFANVSLYSIGGAGLVEMSLF